MKILLFSGLYPHQYEPTLGIFVENRLRHLTTTMPVEAKVIAPVPYFPFKNPVFGRYARAAAAPKVERRHGIDIYHPRFLTVPKLGMQQNASAMFRAGLKAAKKLIDDGYEFDLIDAHYLYPDGVAAMKLAEALKKPFVMTARGSDVTEIARGFMAARQQILTATSKSCKTITVSNSLKAELIEQGADAENLIVLRNGVDTRHYIERNRNEVRSKLTISGPVMVFAGWLIERKRLDIVLGVTKAVLGLTTIIVGDGPERQKLEAQANEMGISDRIHFVGQKTPEQMPDYYSAADVLLLPSDREGWANVLLEAQACGTPVVTRNVGAAHDVVTHDSVGRVVDSDDAGEIALAVSDLLSKKVDRAHVRAHACNYSWDATSKGQYNIFKEAIDING
jgi:glycosyltransferase involved in cell wall biosynthesis